MKILTVDDIDRLHLQIIDASGGSQGIRDIGRIESVVAAQTQVVFGKELYESKFDKAAALTRGIIADHPFVDGNKRTGIMAGLLFLELNHVNMANLKDKELEDFAVSIATDKLSIKQIAKWFKEKSK